MVVLGKDTPNYSINTIQIRSAKSTFIYQLTNI